MQVDDGVGRYDFSTDLPTLELIADRCEGCEFGCFEQGAGEVGCRNLTSIEQQACLRCRGLNGDLEVARQVELFLQVGNASLMLVGAVGKNLTKFFCSLHRAVPFPLQRRIGQRSHLPDDGQTALGQEHTTTHHAICIDELLTERFVLQHVLENLYLTSTPLAENLYNHIGIAETAIEVEQHHMNLSVILTAAESLDVLQPRPQPVEIAHIDFGCHIVTVFVYIDDGTDGLPQRFVRRTGSQLLTEFVPTVVDGPSAGLHFELVLPLVDLITANTIVAICIVAVAGLAQVHHAEIEPIEEDVGRLCGLTIEIDAAAVDELLNGCILESGMLILTTITHQECFVLDVGFGCKDRIGIERLPLIHLLGLEFERRFELKDIIAVIESCPTAED